MTGKSGVSQLGYIGVNATDVPGWASFMQEVTGMQVSDKADDGSTYLRMDDRQYRFLIHPSEQNDVAYIGWQVADEAALDGIAAQVEEAGIKVTPGSKEDTEAKHVLGLIKFEDPSGIKTEVFCGAEVATKPYHPSRASSGFKTGDLGIGHAVLWVPDVDKSLRFYRDVLGFTVSDNIWGRVAFMHCNSRHHSLALFAAGQNTDRRMNHFMIQYNQLDDVGMAYDIAEKRGDEFATHIGRHPNDQNISFYVVNPSGFNTECAWGARDVDDMVWETEMYSRTTTNYWNHPRGQRAEANASPFNRS
jgi:biphenyl-2,3-diol 1,2-dioxygenase